MSKSTFDLGVFSRTGVNELSDFKYNALIGLMILYGLFVNFLMVLFIDQNAFAGVSPFLFLLVYFGFVLAGSSIMHRSQNPLVSFGGYNLIILPIGVLLNMTLAYYDMAVINNALVLTFGIVGLFMTLGSLYPNFFLSIGRALFLCLISVLIIDLISLFLFPGALTFIDYLVVAIFCGYIGFDVARANQIPKTVDNAIDVACAIYLDIINIFIRILNILNKD